MCCLRYLTVRHRVEVWRTYTHWLLRRARGISNHSHNTKYHRGSYLTKPLLLCYWLSPPLLFASHQPIKPSLNPFSTSDYIFSFPLTSSHQYLGNEQLRNQLQHYRRNLKWMKSTKFSNTLYMHPQVRLWYAHPILSFLPLLLKYPISSPPKLIPLISLS